MPRMKPYALYNEIDDYAADWLENLIRADLIAPGIVDRRSIEDLRGDDLRGFRQVHFFAGIGVWSFALRCAGVSDDVPLWTGSCPCQPFSAAGKGGGVDDERHLWPALLHLIRERRPVRFLGEQVASKDGLGWLDLVQTDMEAEGYAIGALDTCSAGSGAPHIRQRLRIGAYDTRRRGGGAERLGHGSGSGPLSRTLGRVYRREEGARPWNGQPERSGPAGRLDHHHHHQGLEGLGSGHRAALGHGEGPLRSTAEAGEFGWLADDDDERRDAPAFARLRDEEHHAEPCGNVVRLADAGRGPVSQPLGGAHRRDGHSAAYAGDRRPGPTNGFWRDADWLHCRDGKWRPVEPEYVEMAHGTSSLLGRGCTPVEDREGFFARMRALLETFGEKAVSERAGGFWALQEQEVLRPHLHGELDGRSHEGGGDQKQSEAIGEVGGTRVRDLQSLGDEAECAPSGREPDEQRPLEFADIVQHLPRSLSLAVLRGRREDADQLYLLQRAIREEGGVSYASRPLEETWASLSQEAQNRIRLDFDVGAWRRVVSFPLVDGRAFKPGSGHPTFEGKSRQGMLKAYGNAIDAEATIDFIHAYFQSERDLVARSLEDILA